MLHIYVAIVCKYKRRNMYISGLTTVTLYTYLEQATTQLRRQDVNKLSGHTELSGGNKCLFFFHDRSCGIAFRTSKALVRFEVLTSALSFKSFGM